MTLLIVAAIWSLAVGTILYLHYRFHTQREEINNFQDSPPVMWDEIPYNAN